MKEIFYHFKRKTIRHKKLNFIFEIKKNMNKENNYRLDIFVCNRNYETKKSYRMSIDFEKFNLKHFQEFMDYFIYDPEVERNIEKGVFDYHNLPEVKTPEHLKKISLSYNVKEVNKGKDFKMERLKIWNDDYSRLNEKELSIFLDKNEINEINEALKDLDFKEKKISQIKRSIYRWCIRGLNTDKAIQKVLNDNEKSYYFMKNNYEKNKRKSYRKQL